jgi:DNA-directed RNA polymerase specialized sigma24 family protein
LKYKVKDERKLKNKYTLLEPVITEALADTSDAVTQQDFELRETLMKNEYEILRLIYGAGYKTHEVAQMLGIEVEACKKRIQTAKRKLAQDME